MILKKLGYYYQTGLFPIMHNVAIKKTALKDNPCVAKTVFEGYVNAKFEDYRYKQNYGWVVDSLPCYGQEFTKVVELKSNTFYPYGLEASKASYEAAFHFTDEQGLSKRLVSLEEMFDASTLNLKESFCV